MRRFLLAVLLATAGTSACTTTSAGPPAAADPLGKAPAAFTSDEDFRSWFAFYYKDPHPERLTASIQYMDKAGYYDAQPEIAAVFLASVFAREPGRLPAWSAEWAKLSPGAWNLALVSLWFAGTPAARQLLEKNQAHASGAMKGRLAAALAGKAAPAPNFLGMEITDPRHINVLWSAFSATGDAKYVQKVIGYVKLYGDEEDPIRNAIGEAALMTLATNVPLHDTVARICMDEDRRNPDERTRSLLESMFTILSQIAQENSQRDQNLPAH